MERNIFMTIEYDGSDFCGWQRQPNVRTVQGHLEEVLSHVCGKEIKLNGTSRTDAGVHALGQCASFRGEFGIPTDRIMLAANNILAGGRQPLKGIGDVRITSLREMPPDFHARFSSRGKKYRYLIRNLPEPDIFRRNYCYQVPQPLDIESMREAAAYIVGTHDFKCFQAAGGEEKETTVRTIYRLCVEPRGEDIAIEVSGDGFLYNMVRIIVGSLVKVGCGFWKPEQIKEALEARDRSKAGPKAPAEGLTLISIEEETLPAVIREENEHWSYRVNQGEIESFGKAYIQIYACDECDAGIRKRQGAGPQCGRGRGCVL